MPLNILFLESFYGGPHRAFADGFARYSNHTVTMKTMPAGITVHVRKSAYLSSAGRIVFNSRTQMEAFFRSLPDFIRKMPEDKPLWAVEAVRKKSLVLYPGCNLADLRNGPLEEPAKPPVVLWNHRWEFDKQPEIFFDALDAVDARGLDFRLLLLGGCRRPWKPFPGRKPRNTTTEYVKKQQDGY